MSFARWLVDFQALHEKAKDGKLGPRERDAYDAAREELATALLAAQQLTLQPGQTARNALRVTRALQLDLELGGGAHRTPTLDISLGGFSALLAGNAVKLGDRIGFALRLPDGEPLRGVARVVDTSVRSGNARVGFAFEGLGAAAQSRLELIIIDTALAAIGRR